MTYFEAASKARAALIDAGLLPETASLDADLLARHSAGWDLATWLMRRSEPTSTDFDARYEANIARRLAREPVAYIRGVQEFWGREFRVTPAVLIPRPETELLVESAIDFLHSRPNARVIDVGTGSGCIAITLALEIQTATVSAVDISPAALDVARQNALAHGAQDRVRFMVGEYLAECPRPVDLIVANPPYVAERDRAGLAREVREHEPAVALFGGPDGWSHIRALLGMSGGALRDDGRLMIEVGYGQAERLEQEVDSTTGLVVEQIREDLQGIPRVGILRRRT